MRRGGSDQLLNGIEQRGPCEESFDENGNQIAAVIF